jgi:hypothetical protein
MLRNNLEIVNEFMDLFNEDDNVYEPIILSDRIGK